MVHSDESILVFIPAYNCAPQIGRVIAQFDHTDVAKAISAILCVDNRSTDATAKQASKALTACPVEKRFLVRNAENYGLGGSHKVAIDFAKTHGYRHVIVLHGDDQGSIADILPLLHEGEHERHDALLGARFMLGSKTPGYSLLRTLGNRTFNLLYSLGTGRRLYDLGSGLNHFHTALFEDDFHRKYPDDLTFNYALIMGLAIRKADFRFFPIQWREDDQISNVRLLRQAAKMLRLLTGQITGGKRYLASEHRQTVRASYPYEIVETWSGLSEG